MFLLLPLCFHLYRKRNRGFEGLPQAGMGVSNGGNAGGSQRYVFSTNASSVTTVMCICVLISCFQHTNVYCAFVLNHKTTKIHKVCPLSPVLFYFLFLFRICPCIIQCIVQQQQIVKLVNCPTQDIVALWLSQSFTALRLDPSPNPTTPIMSNIIRKVNANIELIV